MSEVLEQDVVRSEYEIGRAERIGSVLPLAVELEPGEHLRDAAFRAVNRNGFLNTNVVLRLAGLGRSSSLASIHSTTVAEELSRLVDVLGIRKDAETVKLLLMTTPDHSCDWISFFGVNLRRSHLVGRRRVSPLALRSRNVQKAMWGLQPFNFDLKTKEELLGCCPICHRNLGWSRSYGVNFCDKCPSPSNPFLGAVDLRDFPQPLVDIADSGALQFFADQIDPEAATRRCKWQIHPDLAEVDRGDIFQFAVQLARRLDQATVGWRDHLRINAIEQAARAIINWPRGFDDLIECAEASGAQDVASRVRHLQIDRTLTTHIRSLIKQRVERTLRTAVVSKVNGPESSFLRSMPMRLERPLRHRHSLSRLSTRQDNVHSMEAAVGILRDSPIGRRIASSVGLPVPFLVDLFDKGLLPEVAHLLDGVRGLPASTLIFSVLDLPHQNQGEPTNHTAPTLFRHAFALSNLNGGRWAAIFRAISDGRLTARKGSSNDAPLVEQLYVDDSLLLASIVSDEASASDADLSPLSQGDVAAAFGRSRTTIRNMIRNDLLPADPAINDITEFRKNWMFLSEVRDLAFLSDRVLRDPRRTLWASSVARVSIEDTTVWSRVGIRECFGLGEGVRLDLEFGKPVRGRASSAAKIDVPSVFDR
ncbi:hypothetical protein G6L29_10650 [Agrobacterium rhizogenes]|uniref:hypothetical protein n=1 Tax=Rhizobium rhizogenes TaxID=359 RepID=UPI0015741893|nr:hypothetical protein [Rhizobium rhizogenes]NTI16094.1 hypothetical protein [Rhizobium rhizogenes]